MNDSKTETSKEKETKSRGFSTHHSCSVTFFALACDLFYSAANEHQQQENRKQRRSPLALAKMCVCVCAYVYVFFPFCFFEEQ